MPAGFTIWNPDGHTVQVDDTYRNLAVREQGVINTVGSLFGGGSIVSFNRSGLQYPLLALGGTNWTMGASWNDQSGGFIFNVVSAGPVGTGVPYFIFDVPDNTDFHYGAQVFDSQGRKTFDALRKYLRVVDMFDSNGSDHRSYDASKTYAFIHMVFGFRQWNQIGSSQVVATKATGGVVDTSYMTTDQFPGSPTALNVRTATILVVDVTNF